MCVFCILNGVCRGLVVRDRGDQENIRVITLITLVRVAKVLAFVFEDLRGAGPPLQDFFLK